MSSQLKPTSVLRFPTETVLLTKDSPSGTVAYAMDTDRFHFRQAGAWVTSGQTNEQHTLISNSELKAIETTPITVVSAPGANRIAYPTYFVGRLNYGSEVLTHSGGDLQLIWVDENGDAASQVIAAAGFITATAVTFAFEACVPQANAASAGIVNQPIVLTQFGTPYGGNASNDTTMDVWVHYREVDVA